MLVMRHREGALRLTTQADHARIAEAIAEQWGNESFSEPLRRDSALLAARLHDEGWVESDATPLLDDTGRPLNFLSIDLKRHAAFYGEAVQLAAKEDVYAALLVSMHWTGLYNGRWGWQTNLVFSPPEELREFLDEVVRKQQLGWVRLIEEAWSPSERRNSFESGLWTNYELLQVWDILSLFVCRNDLSVQREELLTQVPLDSTGKSVDLTVRAMGDGRVTVEPYPFARDAFELAIPYVEVPDRDYSNEAAARKEIDEAQKETVTCRISGQ